MEAQKSNPTSSSSSRTNIVIEGTGVSITYLKTDQESFELLTETGVTEPGLQLLIDQIDADGVKEEGLFIDDLKVTVNDQEFTCAWDKIKDQLADQCLITQRPYETLKVGQYLLVHEKDFEALTEEIGVENYRHDMLSFNVESIEPSKGEGHLLMAFTFNGNAITYSLTYSEDSDVCLVDRQGRRHEIKLNY
jgi:hypothetical protein